MAFNSARRSKILTVKQILLIKYYQGNNHQTAANPHLLFDVITRYIINNNWRYDGKASMDDYANLQHSATGYSINCYGLSDLMIDLAQEIGVDQRRCHKFEIDHFYDKKTADTQGVQESFDPHNLQRNADGYYAFENHCIAHIGMDWFDLTLQTKYAELNHGVNIAFSLEILMENNDINKFKKLLIFLVDINQTDNDTNLTLLQQACVLGKYNFVKLLLENFAAPYSPTTQPLLIQPIEMLCYSLHAKDLSLEQKRQLNECLEFLNEQYYSYDYLLRFILEKNLEKFQTLFPLLREINQTDDRDNMTLLHHAARLRAYSIVKFLLVHGANVQHENSNGISTLNILQQDLSAAQTPANQKRAIIECLQLQEDLKLKTNAANIIQTSWRQHKLR